MKKPESIDLKNYKSKHNLGTDERNSEKIGQYLLRKRLINEEILHFALEKQQSSDKLLGEILQEEGYIPEEILQEYSLNRIFNPARSNNLADLLLKIGKISPEQKQELLLRQSQSGRTLGSILIDEGIISPQDFTQKKIIQMVKLVR